MKPAIFLDRDGTINLDTGYVSKIDDFQFFEGAIESLIKLQAKGYLIVLVTNQSGIARGYFTEDDFLQLTEWMDWSLADRGVNLDGIYYCPHHKEGTVATYDIDCDCRKPKPGMILDAAKSLKIDLTNSIMVGDKLDDMRAAKAAGIEKRYLIQWDQQLQYDQKNGRQNLAAEIDGDLVSKQIVSLKDLESIIKPINVK